MLCWLLALVVLIFTQEILQNLVLPVVFNLGVSADYLIMLVQYSYWLRPKLRSAIPWLFQASCLSGLISRALS